jgi:hypothetical protein
MMLASTVTVAELRNGVTILMPRLPEAKSDAQPWVEGSNSSHGI